MKKSVLQNGVVLFLTAVLCTALWGGAFPAIKIGYDIFHITGEDTGMQIIFAGIRFFLAGCLAWVIGSLGFRKALIPQKTTMGYIFILAMLQTYLQYLFFYVGLARTTGVKASIIEAMNVFVALFVAAVLFRQEKLTAKKLLGCGIGFVGVILINITGVSFEFSLWGEGAIVLSTVAYAFSSVCIKKFSKYEEPFTLSAFQFMLGGILLVITGWMWKTVKHESGGSVWELMDGLKTKEGVAIILILAGISAVAYSLWGQLLKYNEVSKVSIYGFLTPVFGVLFSALFLRETTTAGPAVVVISLAFVCVGILLQNEKRENSDY